VAVSEPTVPLHLLPVDCATRGDGTVVFRTSEHSALAAIDGVPAGFETDGFDAATRTGWSVFVHGVGSEITTAPDSVAGGLLDSALVRCVCPADAIGGSRSRRTG
jgi:Pyridoxamine 5'-phosphate oxidase